MSPLALREQVAQETVCQGNSEGPCLTDKSNNNKKWYNHFFIDCFADTKWFSWQNCNNHDVCLDCFAHTLRNSAEMLRQMRAEETLNQVQLFSQNHISKSLDLFTLIIYSYFRMILDNLEKRCWIVRCSRQNTGKSHTLQDSNEIFVLGGLLLKYSGFTFASFFVYTRDASG